jgi:hypothetical protein
MDNATKQKLIKLASYTRSASGNVDTGFASAPMPTKSLQVTPQQSRGNLFDKVKSVAGQTLGITGMGAGLGAKFVANTAVDIAKAGKSTVQTAKDMFVHSNQAQRYAQESANIGYKQDQIMKEYKAGRMSKENYIKALDDVNKAFTAVTKENAKLQLGPSPVDRAKDVAETGVNILTLGELTLAKVGAKEVAEAGGKSTIKALLEGGTANKLESLLLKFPTTRALIERNLSAGATRLASETTAQYVRREAQHVAANLLIKRPIFYQANIAQTESLYKNMMEGDYKGALTDSAWLGVQMVSGGPLGGGKWLADKAGGKASALSYGKGSFIDELSSRIGDGNKAQIARFITKAQQKTTTVGKEIEDAFRVFETKNMTVTKGRAVEAVDNFLRTYTDAGIDLATVTPSQIYKDMDNWYKADKLWREASLAGKLKMTVQEAARYTPVKWDATTRSSIANVVRGAGDNPDDQLKAVLKVADNPGVGFGNNNNLMLRIERIIKESGQTKYVNKEVPKELKPLVEEAKQFDTLDDFISSKTIYRGQPKEFADLQKVENSDAIGNILTGRGVFTTSSKDMAQTYGDNIFQLEKPDKGRVLNLANATDADLDKLGITDKSTRKLYRELLAEGPDTGYFGKTYEIDGEKWRVANIVKDSKTGETQYKLANLSYGGGQKYINKVEFEAKYPPKTTYTSLKDAEDILFEQIAEKHLPPDVTWNEVKMGNPQDALGNDIYIDDVRDRIIKDLKDKGYDWVQHQGGIRAGAGDKLHDVYIGLNDQSIKKADVSKLKKAFDLAENPTKSVGGAEAAAKAIQAIDAAQISPKYIDNAMMKKLNELGYTIAEPVGGRKVPFLDAEDTKKLVSGAIKGSEIFDPSQNPAPVFSTIAGMLERVGLSPREASNQTMRVVGDSVAESIHKTIAGRELGFNLKDTDIDIGGQVVVSRLQRWVENKSGIKALSSISQGKSAITDIRQMTVGEIQEALGSVDARGVKKLLDKTAAKEVRKAIVKGYQEVPLDVRGLGDRITDTLYSYNPLHKYYSRTQSALRYTYNPFFRVQEVSETKILSRIQSSNLLWNKSKAELDDAVKVLNNNNYFGDLGDNIVHGAANLPGEGANDQVLGRISATLSSGQKRDLGGLALDIANSRGMPLDTLLKESPEIIDDALRVVVQYSTKGALSSPLARTMNLVFFPVRYNAKVTKIAADALAKQPPSIQKAVLHSMFNARDWLQSEEGISWQSKNADVIQLLKWITPINSIESTLKLLTGSVNSMGDLGQLGGLPLGIITQILDGQGLINMNTPYVDPKTGNVFPDKVPATDKARAATALGDFINTLFTYPGRTLGLPGKRESINKAIGAVIDTDSSEYIQNIDMTKLTPLQEKWVNILQKGNATQDELDELYNTPNPGQFNWYTLPPINVPTIQPVKPVQPVTPPKPSKSKGSKGKRPKTIARPIQLR